MKALAVAPNLVEQVRDAILEEIASGTLAPGERIIQEQIAQALGVSRQPVQQALALLRGQGVLQAAACSSRRSMPITCATCTTCARPSRAWPAAARLRSKANAHCARAGR